MATYTRVGLVSTDGSATSKEAAGMLTVMGKDDLAIAYLLSAVRSVQESTRVPTAALDTQHNILINPSYWNQQGNMKRSLLAHELTHIMSLYFQRKGERDNATWNAASDCVSNVIIRDGMRLPIGRDWLTPPQGYTGPLIAESIYRYLVEHPEENQGNGEAGQGCSVVEGDGKEESQGKKEIDLETMKELAIAGKGSMAKVFASMEVQPQKHPQWKRYLKKALSNLVANSAGSSFPSYSRVKQFKGALLPRYRGCLPTVAVVIDTSGSMTEKSRSEIVLHVTKLAAEFETVNIQIVAHTDQVVFSGKAKAGSVKAMAHAATQFTGGTLVQPAYDEVKQKSKGGGVDLLIHFTDCEIESVWPRVPAKSFVLCQYGRSSHYGTKPPSGTVILQMENTE